MGISRQNIILAIIGLVVFVAVTIGTYNSFTKPFPGHNDFMSRWEGARSFWVDGLNPYGDEASLNIQRRIYGRAVIEGEDPGLFAYPMYTALFVYPIVNMDYSWASAIWMTLLEACLIGALLMSFSLFQWQPKPLMLGGLILWTLFMYFSARGLLLGQPGHVVYFLEVATLWALYKKHDKSAGVLLALSTIKPQMGFLIVPLLLLWGLRVRRWQFSGGFMVFFGVLMGISFLLIPTWMSDWLAQVALYPSYTELGSPVWILVNFPWLGVDPVTEKWVVSGGFGDALQFVINALLVIFMLWGWFDVLIRRKSERFFWVVMVTLLMTHLVAPRTATPHYVVFIPVLIFYLRELTRPKVRYGGLLSAGILLALFIIPWVHFGLTVVGEFEHPTVYLPIPFIVLGLLVFDRKRWWDKANLIDGVEV